MEFSTASKTEHMVQAYKLAAISSHPLNQTGAVLLNEEGLRTIGQGIGGIPTGLAVTDARLIDEDCYEHAAIAAIYDAALRGKSTFNAIMICPWVASIAVARALIAAGVVRLVVHAPRMQLTPAHEFDMAAKSAEMLVEGGIAFEPIYAPVAGPTILVNDEPWSPWLGPGGAGDFYRGPLGQTYNPRREP
jgi:deoxycytidylate deaminase